VRARALKRREAIVTVATTLGFTAAAQSATNGISFKSFVSSEGGFAFEYPEKWAIAIVRPSSLVMTSHSNRRYVGFCYSSKHQIHRFSIY
jgi:hypothetical protein